ncbi:Uncharacterised protein [Mycobacteroides abscessus]|nr:Uncharacterised protein [Mycobacteroides abscessus]SHV09728.1 Uncharacterised protein [Mycobacteroides abscessus subsp. abscessus]
MPTRRNGQYTSGARIKTVSAVVRSRCPNTNRIPMLTAIRATLSVAIISRTIADRKATRRVAITERR